MQTTNDKVSVLKRFVTSLKNVCNKLYILLILLVESLDHLKGVRSLRIIEINEDENELYHLTTTNGGVIVLYCSERVYEISYSSWWMCSKIHKNYKVYGVCHGRIPERLSKMITQGLSIGPVLPDCVSIEKQKKEIIHAYASLLVSELTKQNESIL